MSAKKIAKLSKPTDISVESLDGLITALHDKINELINEVNTSSVSTPKDSEGSDNSIKIINDQSDGKVKLGIKVNNTWHTVEAQEGT